MDWLEDKDVLYYILLHFGTINQKEVKLRSVHFGTIYQEEKDWLVDKDV